MVPHTLSKQTAAPHDAEPALELLRHNHILGTFPGHFLALLGCDYLSVTRVPAVCTK